MLRKLYQSSLDIVYPSVCHFCETFVEGDLCLCESCEEKLTKLEHPYCKKCAEPFEGVINESFTCPNCHGVNLAFDFALSALKSSSQAKDMVHHFKYARQQYLVRVMAQMMAEFYYENSVLSEEKWLLVPVPMHWWRKMRRSYNQAELLAGWLAQHLKLNKAHLLTRKRCTKNQTLLDRKGRLENLAGAIRLRTQTIPHGTNILLIDDVLTTGSTAHECAKVLRQMKGVQKVAVFTFMRG